MQANATPTARMTIHEIVVTVQPKASDIRAIPYIDAAAPMYVQALQKPLTVDVLPVPANLPGRQEISKKFTECMQALITPANNKQITLAAVWETLIRQAKGMHSTMDRANKIPVPRASLLNTFPLCINLMRKRLMIENIGNATDTRIDSELSLLNASLYRVGSQDSIPSRIKPITIMQTNIGKTPERQNTCQTEPCTSSALGCTAG